MSERITITLEAKQDQPLVSINSFRTALDELAIILREVELEISDVRQSQLYWGISQLSLGSATIGIENMTEESDLAQRTCATSIKGLKVLTSEKKRPEHFNDNALESAQKLARLTSDGISRIAIYSDFEKLQLNVTEQIAVNVRDILEHIEYLGSVEGLLDLISGREGQPLYFRIHDVVTSANVRCLVPDEMLEKALSAFRKRVIVYGNIQSDNSGNPRRIRVQEMELLPLEASEFVRNKDIKYKDLFYGTN